MLKIYSWKHTARTTVL